MNSDCWSVSGSIFRAFVCGALLSLAAGCRTVPGDDLATFSQGLSAAKSQSLEVFGAVDELMAEASVDYAAKQPTLAEANFNAGLDEHGLELWESALSSLEKYAQHLQTLTSPDPSKDFENESVNLSGELRAFGDRLQKEGALSQAPRIEPGLAAGFIELGSLLIRLKDQAVAKQVLIKADPEVRNIFTRMADSIGSSTTEGIRGTVKSHWNNNLALKKTEFLETQDVAKRKQVAAAFQDMLKKRAAQDSALLSLRRSILALADLHHALATGQTHTAQECFNAISQELDRTLDLANRVGSKPGETTPESK